MKKLLIGAMVCLSLAALQSCKKQVIEEREDIAAGSEIISQGRTPDESDGKKGDYFINTLTSELYGPKTDAGWGAPIRFGSSNTAEAKILSGAGAPSPRTGSEGDWYIDLSTRTLYGPKANNQWGSGIVLGGNPNNGSNQDPDESLPDFHISKIGQPTLLVWSNPKTVEVNMNANNQLKLVEVIGREAFAQKRSLEKITIGDKVQLIENQAFENNFALKDIIFTADSELEHIGVEAFTKCNALKTIGLPSRLTLIDKYAFLSCKSLETVVVPGSCERILSEAFKECENLKNVTLNEGVKLVDNLVFEKCFSLTKITFPASLTGLGELIFNETTQKISVTFLGAVPQTNDDANPFAGATIEHIYVPSQHLQAYRDKFTDYADIIQAIQ